MRPTTAVRARTVTKTFGDVIALDGVDLDVPAGQIHGLVGPNGAGKTTLLALVLGLAAVDGGTLEILGSAVGATRAGGVAGFVDGPGLYPTLTARQNLTTLARLRGHDQGRRAQVEELLERVGLDDVADDRVRGFSLGMRQRLGLAAALLGDPRLLVLDEPANGLDPAGKRRVHEVLADLADHGTTVLLSSHRMDDLAALCDEVTLLSVGRAVFTGPVSKLASESGRLDYRLVTSDPPGTRRIAAGLPALTLLPSTGRAGASADDQALVVRGAGGALDDLVVRLVGAGIALRELGPVVSPLEAAFLALTGADADADTEEPPR
ncbi:ABC transporter ATP-binding protein [Nocardioides sp.]|uniref:ABC transporter ATP-binding protein n=1 Tax=Nocardioides sp. TaxID=35761 RepID=UPI0025D5AA9D|nr:ABC transporter ATP-binding protein [Nocardioides sp.]